MQQSTESQIAYPVPAISKSENSSDSVFGFLFKRTILSAKARQPIKNHFTIKPPQSPIIAPTIISMNSSTPTAPFRKWAYAFIMGGCNPQDGQYRGIFYGSVVSAWILRRHGTKADIVFLIHMSSKTNDTVLPSKEESLLKAMNITTIYVPKFKHPSMEIFYSIIMEKFRILNLAEYSRVFFLDSDVMPLCSLDYMFELSEPAQQDANGADAGRDSVRLKENVILTWNSVPAIAGTFILRPGPSEYQEIQDIIRRTESKALRLPFPYFDKVEGWGHNFSSTDYWRSFRQTSGQLWDYYGADSDQGLLLYWTKYHKKSVSIIHQNQVEHWEGHNKNGTVLLETRMDDALGNFSCSGNGRNRRVPYQDFVHFTGKDFRFRCIDIEFGFFWYHALHE